MELIEAILELLGHVELHCGVVDALRAEYLSAFSLSDLCTMASLVDEISASNRYASAGHAKLGVSFRLQLV